MLKRRSMACSPEPDGDTWLAAVGAAGALVITTAPAEAQQKKPSYQDLERRIQRLERLLEQKGTGPDLYKKPAAVAPTAEAPVDQQTVENIVDEKLKKQKVTAGFKDGSGFFIESPSGDFKAKFRGLVQADSRWFPENSGKTNNDNFYLRRARPIFEGTLFKYFDYKFTPDFGLGTTVIQDAYGDVNYFQPAKVRAGKFKDPFSLERLQSASDVQFVERSLAENLAPNRDVGVQAVERLAVQRHAQVPARRHERQHRRRVERRRHDERQGRLRPPLRHPALRHRHLLGEGLRRRPGRLAMASRTATACRASTTARWAARRGSSTTRRRRSRSTPTATGTATRPRPTATGDRSASWRRASSTPRSSGAHETFKKPKTGPSRPLNTNAKPFNYGWFAQVSYVLTGENASYKGVTPINNFDPRNGRWGAFELAFRASQATIDDVLFERGFASEKSATNHATEYTFGVNWYLNRALKFQLNYGRTNFGNGISYSTVGPAPRDHEDVILTNFQVAF